MIIPGSKNADHIKDNFNIFDFALTEEEMAVFKRGRNAHVNAIPHNASRGEYLKATAVECLFGYLYLHGATGRINQLFTIMMEETDDAT